MEKLLILSIMFSLINAAEFFQNPNENLLYGIRRGRKKLVEEAINEGADNLDEALLYAARYFATGSSPEDIGIVNYLLSKGVKTNKIMPGSRLH